MIERRREDEQDFGEFLRRREAARELPAVLINTGDPATIGVSAGVSRARRWLRDRAAEERKAR